MQRSWSAWSKKTNPPYMKAWQLGERSASRLRSWILMLSAPSSGYMKLT